jgi:hypothetical protein
MINLIAFFHTPLLSHKTNNTTTHHHTRTVFLRNNHAEKMLLVLPILLHGTVTIISSSGLSSPVSTVTLSILPAPTDLTDTEQ